ncbi:MAG TPA: glycosyltransferase family 2 protein [bacterium]|nr:glycosyltransferase family 2 protein [bacterium]
MIDLSVVIITHNSRKLLEKCVGSVMHATRDVEYEVIVIENGSSDGSAEWLEGREDIRSIINEKNNGVAPARNQGLAVAKGRYLLILDVDTLVEPGSLDLLVSCMDAHPEVGLGAPKLTDGAGELQYTCRYYPTVMSKLYRRIPAEFARKRLEEEMMQDWDHAGERYVDYVIGACQIFRREAFEAVGPLDESIFYGPEDIDYCIRMWRAGWKVMYFPQCVVRHLERRITTRLMSAMTLKHAVGLAHFFLKHRYVMAPGKLPGSRSGEKQE